MEPIEFTASIPAIQSAFQTGSDGARIKLDVPEVDMPAVLRLIALGRSKSLKVRVEIDE